MSKYLPEAEQIALVRRAQRGDVAARNRLVETSIGQLWRIARQANRPRGMSVEDLVGAGAIGIMRAIQKFDLRRHTKFTTYAQYWIWSHVNHEVVRWRFGKTSDWHRKHLADAYHERLADGATEDEAVVAACAAGKAHPAKPETVRTVVAALYRRDCSLDKLVHQDGEKGKPMPFVECLPGKTQTPEQDLLQGELQKRVRRVLFRFRAGLRPVEVVILDRRVLDDEDTLQGIGTEFSLSRERIRQLEQRLRRNLRVALKLAGLGDSERTELTMAVGA